MGERKKQSAFSNSNLCLEPRRSIRYSQRTHSGRQTNTFQTTIETKCKFNSELKSTERLLHNFNPSTACTISPATATLCSTPLDAVSPSFERADSESSTASSTCAAALDAGEIARDAGGGRIGTAELVFLTKSRGISPTEFDRCEVGREGSKLL